MRLVIPYRYRMGGVELRYAIRSIYKHFKNLSGVLLIGDAPEWYKITADNHIPLADLKGEKEKSMQLKVLQCPDAVFLYSNDDYYALEDFDYQVPHYYDTTCRDMATRHPIKSYREMYYNCQPDWLNFDVHTPMIMEKQRFINTFNAMDGQTPIKTTYAQGLPGWYLADCKIAGEHNLKELEYRTKDRPFFSTHDSAVNPDLLEFLQKLYPDASPCE